MMIGWRPQLAHVHKYLLDVSHYFDRSYSAATEAPGLETCDDLEEIVLELASLKRFGGLQLILNQLGSPLS